jgi:hypothetical protein
VSDALTGADANLPIADCRSTLLARSSAMWLNAMVVSATHCFITSR